MASKRILVTGANKGIGFAICESLLSSHPDTSVLLGSRDAGRGKEAVEKLLAAIPAAKDRVELLMIDTASDSSVEAAAKTVGEKFGREGSLYGIINNAGIFPPPGTGDLGEVFEVNVKGPWRVCNAFMSMLDQKVGRVVNIASAAGPMFLAKISEDEQKPFLDPNVTWDNITALMTAYLTGSKSTDTTGQPTLMNAYGLSKALLNAYTRFLFKQNPHLTIVSCTPGFIETDMTRGFATSQNKTPQEMGMKGTEDGAKVPVALMMEPVKGNGWYYGSDGLRSPLDKYRGPCDPEYTD
mmetsp:Transcript_10195/g.25165  ORF Transcript_10195/g.25165 Transcript_10195/m.25165 type:complete len:296 (+) Transcript_10195:29-916(+)